MKLIRGCSISIKCSGDSVLSEEKIHDLHERLADKLIEKAKLIKEGGLGSIRISLENEIVSIRREINDELRKMEGRT